MSARRVVCIVVLGLLAGTASSEPEAYGAILCRKKSGLLAARDACKAKEMKVDPAALGLVGPMGPTGLPGPPGSPGPSVIAAFANLASGGTVRSFGGSGTTAVSVDNSTTGDYLITFTGSFPAGVSPDKATVLATARPDTTQVTSGYVYSASPTAIMVEVTCWFSQSGTPFDEDVSVAVLLAE